MGDEEESNLEMRCSADEAWYDGTLSVSPESKDLIVVHFNDFDEDEDETFHRSELKIPGKLRLRVRVRSLQLQDAQCNRVYKTQKICGCLDDGEDRKYYDAEVTSIVKRKHSFKDDGEECLCKFTLLWLDGPKKREHTEVGCAEVCFLSLEPPEDDPMVKNLLKSLTGVGDQPRRKLVKSVPKGVPKSVPKSAPSSRPRTPSPSLELAPLKKQPSKEPSPPDTQPNQKVLELARTRSLPIGSKKKRIMRAEEELTDRASNNDEVEMDGRGISRHRSEEGDEEATGHGDESDAAERRVMSVGSEGKKGSVQAAEKKRLVKGKAKVGTPEVIDREEAAREGVMQHFPRRTFKQLLKSTTANMVTPEVAVRDKTGRQDMVTQSLGERVKLIKTAKMAAPDAATAAAVCDEAIIQDKIVQSLGERVKLKTAQKNPAVSPVEAHKDSLQKIGKQVVRKQITKRRLIQLEDPSLDPSSLKFNKVVKPRTTLKPKEIIAPAEPNNVELDQLKVQKRKAGRPRKHPLPEAAKLVTESTIAKKQKVVESPSEQKQSPREEEIVDANVDQCSSDPANKTTKKRPRDDERSQHDSHDIVSDKSSHEEETLDAHVKKQANQGKKKKMIIGDHARVPPHDDTVSDKSARSNDMAEDHGDHEDHSPLARHVDEANEMSCHMENKSIAERFRDIENKYRYNVSSFSTPQAAQELISLAGSHQYRENPTEDQHFRISSPHHDSASHLDQERPTIGDETGASGKPRVGKQLLVITDDDDSVSGDMTVPPEGKQHDLHASDDAVDGAGARHDECSPVSDLNHTCSAVDEELVIPKQDTHVLETRLLLLENLEADASALDAMQLLQRHTDGVCAVHVLPVLEFQASATGYALYRDAGSALKACRWLTSSSRFVVSPNGRPWIVSQTREVYGPHLCGFAVHTSYKSDDPGMCGIISDQPHSHDLVVVTKRDNTAYFQAQQMSKTYEEHKKWQKELYERIVQHKKKG